MRLNKMNEQIYLVYVNFAGKVHAQKWFGSKLAYNGKSYPPDFFACEPRLLTDHDRNLTLHELTTKYPAPNKKENNNAS